MNFVVRWLLKPLQKLLLKFGVELRRFNPVVSYPHRRAAILSSLGVSHVIDVGANVGQYGRELRTLGYNGSIMSFEPMPGEFARLSEYCRADNNWTAMQVAIADYDGSTAFHVTTNSVASSLLEPVDDKVSVEIDTKVAKRIEVSVRRLDGVVTPLLPRDAKVFLKVDAQGSEAEVLAGAASLIPLCVAIELEISTLPLYKGQAAGLDILNDMRKRGWSAVSFNAECVHPKTMMVLQNDVLFVRTELVA